MRVKLVHESFKTTSHSIFNEANVIKEIKASKNQDASFQILLELDKKSAINISNTIGFTQNLRLPKIRVCIKSNLEYSLLNEGFLKDENEIEYADLLSKTPIMVHPANRLSAVWVDLHIDKDTPAGLYPVEVNLYQSVANSDEVLIYSETIEVEVLEHCLPDPKDYQMYLDLWQHNSNIARYYEVPLWSDEHFRVLEEVTKSLALLGQKSIMILASEAPWNGWGSYIMSKDNTNLFEHSIIQLSKTKDNKLVCDFSAMQRYIDLCFKYDIKGDISLYGLLGVWVKPLYPHLKIKDYPEPLQIRYYDETDGSYKYLKEKEEVLEYIKIIYKYFESTNQLQYLRIAADEPSRNHESIQSYKDTLKLIKTVAPNIKFKIAFDKDDVIETFKDDVDDIATSFPCTTRNFESFSDDKRKLWYVCNIPDKPNTFLRSPLLEARLLGSLNQVFNYNGLLRWAYTCWTENPREDIRYAAQGFPVGDICLVYPEKDGSVALSLRWKALKRGIEDNELISILKQQGKYIEVQEAYRIIKLNTKPNEYMKEAKITIDDFYSLNHLDYETYRLHLIQSIQKDA